MVSSLNDNEIDFKISFDESDDEDYTVIFYKNSFSYKIISVKDLKTDSENDNEIVNMPSFSSAEPTVSYFDDLDFFKDFDKEFPVIVYNDALTSKSDSSTEPVVIPQRIDEYNLKDETSLSECDEEEQNRKNSVYKDIIHEDSGRYQTWSLLKEIPNTPPSLATSDAPHLVGCPLSVVASRVALYHQELEALHVRLDRVESIQTSLGDPSSRLKEASDGWRARAALEDTRAKVLELWTRLSASESSEMSLITRLLMMEERISALEVNAVGAGAIGPTRGVAGGNAAPEVHRLLGIIVNRLKSGSYRVKSGRHNSYLRDILGKDMHYRDILGKDMHYPFTLDLDLFKLAVVLQKAKQIQDFGPISGIRASRGTLMMMKHHTMKMHQTMKEVYDIWAMKMEHYLEYIDNDVWKVIQNGNSKKRISTGKDGVVRVLPPVSAAEIHAVEKERKARTILLMAIPKEHLRRFHGMDDAKEIWEAIRTRFGGNANSKKMQKDLEAHGAEVSTEDANHKFLRSLPPAWSNLAMTMRTKPDVDTLSIDDLYNNLRVFEQELTSTSKSSASAQNVAFVSHSKSSTNKVKSGHTGAYSTYTPSTSSNNIPEREVPAGFADEVIYSLFAKQSEDLDLLHEDLEQIDDMDIEEMDINWQIAMIAIRMKKFYKKTGRRVRIDGNKPVGFDKKKLECFKCHNTGHFARECPSKGTNDGKKRDSFYQDQGAGKKEQNQNCLLTMDDGVVNWGEHTEEEVETNHALMAISSNNEVSLCSKTCIDSYNKLKTLCDEQTNQLGEQEVKILAYDQAVKKLEAQVVTFQKQQLSLNEQLTFQANELYEKDEKLKKYRRIGMKAVKEKEQLQKNRSSTQDHGGQMENLIVNAPGTYCNKDPLEKILKNQRGVCYLWR
ncbi:ribonuclease H-like domain-containing protein [Tanacetum coccineum]